MSQLIPGDYCKARFNGYRYGFSTVASTIAFDDLSTLHASIWAYVDQYIEERVSNRVSTGDTPIICSNIYNDALLSSTLDQINSILAGSNSLIELDLGKLLSQLLYECRMLKDCSDMLENANISNDKMSRFIFGGPYKMF